MAQAYLILAHKNIEQLDLLINKLNVNNNSESNQVYFIKKRVNCVWGDFSIVKATCLAIDYLVNLNREFTHCVLMSGMDFPIKSNEEIDIFLNKNINNDFVDFSKDNIYCDSQRYSIYYFKYAHLFKNKIINDLVVKAQYKISYLLKIERNHPLFSDIYFGSQWWVLSKKTLKSVNDFLKNNPKYINFYKNTNIPDEFFFQTIIVNQYNENIINNNLHYMIWEEGAWHPNTLTMKDKENILKSDKLFARKFDINVDEGVIKYLSNTL